AVNSVEATTSLTQTTINGWKSDVSAGRTNVYTATTNLSAAEDGLKTAQSDLTLAEQELILDKAGSTVEQIAAQEAEVEQAKANADNYRAQLAKTILRSPINGIVTKQDGNVGEIIAANTTLVSLISENNFKIEANIPETDIAKVKIGNTASLTLDAYGNSVIFEATVTAVDPAETVIEGVSTYKTTFHFTKEDERIKSGMTANIDILTDKRENVIALPLRAVIGQNGGKIVKVLNDDGKISEVPVESGLKGSDGNLEIIKGINEGDKVIIYVK
ncbi:MAG: efflux RND transporter periplasmic adaptor subunit, partial [Candidatus Paceibacterota bacterium]